MPLIMCGGSGTPVVEGGGGGGSDYVSVYPPEQSDIYVKATSQSTPNHLAYYATDPTKSLTGAFDYKAWLSLGPSITNQRFHIDLGSAKIVKRIYYENMHGAGLETDIGARNFTFWSSNTASAFANLTYATDTNWTQLTTATSLFQQHVAADIPDPKYIVVTNTTAYRYYAFKFADNYGDSNNMGVRRIELQIAL